MTNDSTVWFKERPHLWAASKDARGPSYTLTDDRYQELVKATSFAANLVDKAVDFVQQAGARGLRSSNLVTPEGDLTDLGQIANHFNLIRAMDYEGPPDEFVKGALVPSPDFKKPSLDDVSVQTLHATVVACLQFTAEGLRGGLVFRGIDPHEIPGRKQFGKVTLRRGGLARTREGKRVSDTFHPESNFTPITGLFTVKKRYDPMPSLSDDKIFLNAEQKLLGAIHIDYQAIDSWSSIFGNLANDDATLAWTIVHEATHKFARTRDVNSAYTIAECRQLHWHSALRNASHYERLVGLDLSKVRGKQKHSIVNLIREP